MEAHLQVLKSEDADTAATIDKLLQSMNDAEVERDDRNKG